MKLSQFNFDLPQEQIAREPARWRDEARLLVLHKQTGELEHRLFKDIIDYFGKDDLFVLNDTKVFPSRPQTSSLCMKLLPSSIYITITS